MTDDTQGARIPRIARRLLQLVLPARYSSAILGDLQVKSETMPVASARRWYWRQTLRALSPPMLLQLYRESYYAASPSERASMSWLLAHCRYIARGFRRHPGRLLIPAGLLSLGLSSALTVFIVLQEIASPAIGLPHSGQLYAVVNVDSTGRRSPLVPSTQLGALHQRAAASGIQLGVVASQAGVLQLASSAVDVVVTAVSPELPAIAGLTVAYGRMLDPQVPGSEVVLRHDFWVSRFGGDRSLLGKQITIGAASYTVVGVLAPGVTGPWRSEVWRGLQSAQDTGAVQVIARLPDASAAAAATAAVPLWRPPVEGPGASRLALQPLASSFADPMEQASIRTGVIVLAVLAILALIAACTNAANQLLLDVLAREREIAIRISLGASRRRLGAQFLFEYVVLALPVIVLSLAGTATLIRLLPSVLPFDPGAFTRFRFDNVAALLTVVISAVVTLMTVMVPFVQAMRVAARRPARGLVRRLGATNGFNALVVTQVIETVPIVLIAALLIRSEAAVRNQALGFVADGTTVLTYTLPRDTYDSARVARWQARLVEQIHALPGVDAVGIARPAPIIGVVTTEVHPDGGAAPQAARRSAVSAEFFRAMGTTVAAGRAFHDDERPSSVIVSERLAASLWGNGDPIGRSLRLGTDTARYSVVGVTRDGTYGGVEPVSFVFTALAPKRGGLFTLVVRGSLAQADLIGGVRRAAHQIDPAVPVGSLGSLDRVLDQSRVLTVTMRTLATCFGVLALIITTFGLYSNLNRHVSVRAGELSLRLALGASPQQLIGLVVGRSIKLATAGVIVGGVAAFALAQTLASFLFGVRAADPGALAAVAASVLFIVIVAAAIPSWRAARLQPARVLSDV